MHEADIKPWLRAPPKTYVLRHATIVDAEAGVLVEGQRITVAGGKIAEVTAETEAYSPTPLPLADDPDTVVVDCRGLFVCPGLIDAHVHVAAVPGFADLSAAFGTASPVSLLRQPYVCAAMLARGFTSARDCGGATAALKDAIAEGIVPGPRLFIAGRALSQTGGHADLRGRHERGRGNEPGCCAGTVAALGRLCDGEAQCLQAARDELRTGADFIKIMGSGGVSSPTDALHHLQFTTGEIRAMVEAADNAGTYVTAHAYTAEAVRHCVEAGVRGIEHGNFIDAPTAALLAERDVFLTPTLVTYEQMASPRWEGYLPAAAAAKNEAVLEAGLAALRVAEAAGVPVCYGSDLLGPLGAAQTREFSLRARALPPAAILRSATVTPARMLGRADTLGQICPGFEADLLLLRCDPLADISVLDDPEANVLAVMKEGRVYKSRCDALVEDAAVPVRVKSSL